MNTQAQYNIGDEVSVNFGDAGCLERLCYVAAIFELRSGIDYFIVAVTDEETDETAGLGWMDGDKLSLVEEKALTTADAVMLRRGMKL